MNKETIILNAHPLVVNSIKKYALSKGEWNDLYQEGMLHLLELFPSFDETKGVTVFAYFKNSLKYFYLNFERYAKPHSSLNTIIDIDGNEWIDLIADESVAFDQQLVQDEQANSLRRAMNGLEEEEKQLLNLIYYKGMTLDETANSLKLSISAVFRRKEKLIKKLRNICEKN